MFAGIGTRHEGARGLRATAEEARLALASARLSDPRPHVVQYDATGLHRMLIDWSASRGAIESARDQLAPLDALGPERAEIAITTLRAYLDHGTVAGAARALHLHRNAVSYRLRWIDEALGADLADPDQRLILQLACRLRALV